MADYYPLVARAVTMLDKGTGEARRALYERARNALVAQLRSLNPPLTESEITRERLSLEEAIRKVETEAARRTREKTRIDPADPKRAEPPGGDEKSERPNLAPSLSSAPVEFKRPIPVESPKRGPGAPTQTREPSGPPPDREFIFESPAPNKPPQAPANAPAPRGATDRPRPPAANGRSTIPEPGLKGFRDVVADAETLGKASAQASKNAREVYAAAPGEVEFERVEPRVEPQGLRPPNRDAPPRPTPPRDNNRDHNRDSNRDSNEDRPPIPRAYYRQPRERDAEHTQRSRRGLIVAVSTIVILVGVALTAYWQRDRISGLFGATRTAIQAPARDPNAARPKLTDRVGQPQDRARTEPPAAPQNVAPVAQRVVLYEEDPADSAGKRYVGSAIWRTEMVAPSPGAAPEMVIKAEMEIPERRLGMTISIRRNRDQSLPASHTVEIMFNLPPDFPFGGINNVPGLLMKQAEQTRGAPLSGLAVKVTSNFFLVGLSAVEAEVKRNIQLLKERVWLDIPVIYNNGRRAIIAIEKGTPGERAFNEAFAAWGQ